MTDTLKTPTLAGRDYLDFHKPLLGEEEEREVIETLRSGWLTTGPRTKEFEKRFAEYAGARHAVGVNSCTAALHLALVAQEIREGAEVITSPITFPATANVIVHERATPVFAEVEPDTLNLDVARLERYVTKKTRAIIPVHFAGQPVDMDPLLELARKHQLVVIEDAAHAAESVYKGRKIGTIGTMTAFSFYATKNLTTGEGGMLTTNDDALIDKLRMLSLHGISKDAWKRYSNEGYQHWEVIYPGYKYNMFDLQAALGLHQLAKVEKFWKVRAEYARLYDEGLTDLPGIRTLATRPNLKHARHLYVIRIDQPRLTISRDDVMNLLQKEYGIGVGVHFRALHLQPYYRETFGFKPGQLPEAEKASDELMSLPLYPRMTREDVHRVIAAVRDVITKHQR